LVNDKSQPFGKVISLDAWLRGGGRSAGKEPWLKKKGHLPGELRDVLERMGLV